MVIDGPRSAVTVNESRCRIPVYSLRLIREASVQAEHKRVSCAADVFVLLRNYLEGRDREVFGVIFLDTQMQIRGIHTVTVGTLDAALVHPREVFKPAILASSASIIVFHNHPSGDPTPSMEDRSVTAALAAAGQIIGIELLDHVIVGETRYTSFAESGLL